MNDIDELLEKFTAPISIKVKRYESGNYSRIQVIDKSDKERPLSGLYIFWWTGPLILLKEGNLNIRVKGNQIKNAYSKYYDCIDSLSVITKGKKNYIRYDYKWCIPDEFPFEYGLPLYVGKTTNINRRLGEHIMARTKEYGAITDKYGCIIKKRTSCQLRSHMEFIFQKVNDSQKRLDHMMNNVKVSYMINKIEDFGERFYLEDLLIGALRPMFNIDSER